MTARIDTLDPADRQLLRYAAVIGRVVRARPARGRARGRGRRRGGARPLGAAARVRLLGRRRHASRSTTTSSARPRTKGCRSADAASCTDASERRSSAAPARQPTRAHRCSRSTSSRPEVYDRAWRYAVLAGHRAKQTLANVVAAELFERALAAAEQLPALAPESSRRGVGVARRRLRDLRELRARRRGIRAKHSRWPRAPAPRARLLWKTGVVQERVGEYDDAIEHYAQALTVLSDDDERGVGRDPDRARARDRRRAPAARSLRRGEAVGGARSRARGSGGSAEEPRARVLPARPDLHEPRPAERALPGAARCRSTARPATSSARRASSTTSASVRTSKDAGRRRSSSTARAARSAAARAT